MHGIEGLLCVGHVGVMDFINREAIHKIEIVQRFHKNLLENIHLVPLIVGYGYPAAAFGRSDAGL